MLAETGSIPNSSRPGPQVRHSRLKFPFTSVNLCAFVSMIPHLNIIKAMAASSRRRKPLVFLVRGPPPGSFSSDSRYQLLGLTRLKGEESRCQMTIMSIC